MWRLTLELGPEALRGLDPLPSVLQLLMELEGLQEHRERLYIILAELFSNALEHGILGLDSALKRSPDGFAEYYTRRKARLEALSEGHITIDCQHLPGPQGNKLILGIEHTGAGFDYEQLPPGLEENGRFCGRGIELVRSLCEDLKYTDGGNKVQAVYAWDPTTLTQASSAAARSALAVRTVVRTALADAPLGGVLILLDQAVFAYANSWRLMNKPMIMSCIKIFLEKQIVFRTNRLMRVLNVRFFCSIFWIFSLPTLWFSGSR